MKIYDQLSLDARLAAIDARVEQLASCFSYLQTLIQLHGKANVEAITLVREELSRGDEAIRQLQDWLESDDNEYD